MREDGKGDSHVVRNLQHHQFNPPGRGRQMVAAAGRNVLRCVRERRSAPLGTPPLCKSRPRRPRIGVLIAGRPQPALFGIVASLLSAALTSDCKDTVTAPPLPRFVAANLAAGSSHTCGVKSAGAAYCWGDNTYGQLGTGSTASTGTPVAVAGGFVFGALAAGARHTCGVASSGAAYCWGDNAYGKLGTG